MTKTGQTPKSWPEAAIRHPESVGEAITYFLFENGALGVQQEDGGQAGWQTARAGFPADFSWESFAPELDAFLAGLVEIFGLDAAPVAVWGWTPAGDWTEKWKENLTPVEIGRSLVVVPSWWDKAAYAGRAVIELDPGMAFGTGHHDSTALCLLALEDILGSAGGRQLRVLDIGSGSGILALACAVLGQETVFGIDNDPEAMPVAAENAANNRLSDRVLLACAEPRAVRGRFDLITANLTANLLIDQAPEISRLAAPEGLLVMSGILDEQAESVRSCYERHGFQTKSETPSGEWVGLVMMGPAAG